VFRDSSSIKTGILSFTGLTLSFELLALAVHVLELSALFHATSKAKERAS